MNRTLSQSTQYGDATGTLAIDGWEGLPLHELARVAQISLDGALPVAATIELNELQRTDRTATVVLFVNVPDHVNATIESVLDSVGMKSLQVVKLVRHFVPLDDILSVFKRFNFSMAARGIEMHGVRFKVVESIVCEPNE